MGWLFACFGHTKKRKRPTKASKFGPKCRRIRSYQPLQADTPKEPGASESLSTSNLELRDEPKEEKKARTVRKKVRFNMDVITYEPIPANDDDDASYNSQEDDESGHNWNETQEEENEKVEAVCLVYAPLSETDSKLPPYSPNHRYSNNYDDDEYDDEYEYDDDDEEDEEISDLDDDDDDGDCLIDPQNIYHEEIEDEHHHFLSTAITSLTDEELLERSSNKNARFRSHYIVPVLNPVETLSQWKAIKTRKC